MTTDEALMIDAQRGVRDAVEQLFDRYRGPVWRFFRRRVADPARAEELAQDVFVAILQGTTRYVAAAPFRSYLFAVAYNILLADRRKASHRQADPLEIEPVAAGGGDRDVAIWVQRGLRALDADDREVLMLREYEQLSYQEIADLLQMPLNTVRSRLFRARMALKAVLERPVLATMKVTP